MTAREADLPTAPPAGSSQEPPPSSSTVERGFQAAAAGLDRVVCHDFRCSDGLLLQVSVAPSPTGAAAKAVLYVLDPEPSMFGLAALHHFSEATYGDNPGADQLAVVGVGFHPSLYALTGQGWKLPALRELRASLLIRDPDQVERFRRGLCEEVLPFVEQQCLGVGDAAPARAILGSSFTSLFALQLMWAQPCAFQCFVLGSPGLFPSKGPGAAVPVLEMRIFALEEEAAAQGGGYAGQGQRALVVYGGDESSRLRTQAQELCKRLKQRGVGVQEKVLEGEDHGSIKPATISRGMKWFQQQVFGGRQPSRSGKKKA